MKHAGTVLFVAAIALLGTLSAQVWAGDGDNDERTLRATLRGIEEPPSVSSTGRGTFRGTISEDATSLSYTLSYEDLEGDVQQAHIHLGQKGVNGGIAVFLCSNLGNGPAGTPECPGPRAGTVSGTVTGA
jgi:CHRD domain